MSLEKTTIDPGDLGNAIENSVNDWQCRRAAIINQDDGITSQGDAPVQENLGCDETTNDQTKVRRSMRNHKLRSKSCSEISSLQPKKQTRCVKPIIECEEDIDIDEGNELVKMIKTKLTMSSPKLAIHPPSLEETVTPESSPAKSIFSPTLTKSNSSHHTETVSCHPHSDINPAILAIIQGYQNTISQIIYVSDDRYDRILNLQQQQLENFQKQQQEQFSFFQKQIMQHQYHQQPVEIPPQPQPTPDLTLPSPTIIFEEITNPSGAGNNEISKKKKGGKKKNVKPQDSLKQQQEKNHENQKSTKSMPTCSSITITNSIPGNSNDSNNNKKATNETSTKLANAAAGSMISKRKELSGDVKTPPPSLKLIPSDSDDITGSTPITCKTPHKEPKLQDKMVMVLGSSIVKHASGRNIWEYSGYRTKICCFPGAGYQKLADHTEVELQYAKPEVAILHVGGNDLANSIEVDTIAENIAYLGLQIKERGVKRVAISGMTPRKNLIKEIPLLNKTLQTMCKTYGFDFIDNGNIKFGYKGWDGQPKSHLSADRIHLNYSGVELLEDNFIYYLKDLKIVDEN